MKLSVEEIDDNNIYYDNARKLWISGITSTYLSKKMDSTGIHYDFDVMRSNFRESVKILRDLHLIGAVESIEGLPRPKDIDAMEGPELVKLSVFLNQNYFPNL